MENCWLKKICLTMGELDTDRTDDVSRCLEALEAEGISAQFPTELVAASYETLRLPQYTGDLACQRASGAYAITGRKTSVIVLPTGKKVCPEELEAYFAENPLVSECLVYAGEQDGEQLLCVSVYPDLAVLTEMLSLPADTDLTTLSAEDTARAKTLLLDIVRDVNARLPNYKHVRHLVVRKTEFAKTAAQKIRRGIPENTDNGSDVD